MLVIGPVVEKYRKQSRLTRKERKKLEKLAGKKNPEKAHVRIDLTHLMKREQKKEAKKLKLKRGKKTRKSKVTMIAKTDLDSSPSNSD